MAAGLGFKTFTSGEVLTAADVNGYLMQGVLVFASAAARTSAIASPQEGQVSFLKDTNSTEYYDGSAWQVVGNAGGETLISTTSLTGASITLSSIPSTYNDLKLVVRDFLPATDTQRLALRFNGDSGANYSTSRSSSTAGAVAFADNQAAMTETQDNAVTNSLVVIDIPDYANTATWKIATSTGITVDTTTTTSGRFVINLGAYNQTGAISSITLLSTSGNLTSGSVLLYGVK